MFVLSCEPATCAVPEWHRDLFKGREETLAAEGWAPGSLNLAQAFATKLRTLLAHGDITCLLIDFSRRPDDPARFSRFSAALGDEQRKKLDERHHLAHLNLLRQRIREELQREGRALHLAIRTEDRPGMPAASLHYDPARAVEAAFVTRWIAALQTAAPDLHARAAEDPGYGLSAVLREDFPDAFGSVSLVAARSAFLEGKPLRWDKLKKLLLETLPRE